MAADLFKGERERKMVCFASRRRRRPQPTAATSLITQRGAAFSSAQGPAASVPPSSDARVAALPPRRIVVIALRLGRSVADIGRSTPGVTCRAAMLECLSDADSARGQGALGDANDNGQMDRPSRTRQSVVLQ